MYVAITHNYPTDYNPVAGLFVKDHARQIEERTGEEVRVLYLPSGIFPMTKAVTNPLKWPKLMSYFLNTGKQIRREIEKLDWEQGEPVKIIAHWWFPNGTFAAKSFAERTHVICHGTDLYQLRKYPAIAKYFAERAKRVQSWQCVSEDLKRILLDLYPFLDESRIEVEPMPISSYFRNLGLRRDPNQLISVGSLIPRKGHDALIREVAKVPDARLDIFGQGPEEPKLLALIQELGVSGRVVLRGQVPREELLESYNRSVLFTLLSYDEGFGLVLKEAQACGCKTLAYTGDGMADTGLDFPVERTADVAGAIKAALDTIRDTQDSQE